MSVEDLPADVPAERSVLGSILIRERISDVLGIVEIDDFMIPAHREIYESLVDLSAKREPLDVVTVASELRRRGIISRLPDGEMYLMGLSTGTPTAESGAYYAKIVRERATSRRLISACADAGSRATREPPDEVVADLRVNLASLRSEVGGPVTMADAMPGYLETLEGKERKTVVTRVPSGIASLDHKLLGGAAIGTKVVIGGNAGMGKSSLAFQWALTAARSAIPTYYVSLEMARFELIDRGLAFLSGIDGSRLAVGTGLAYDDWLIIREHSKALAGFPLSIDDRKLNIDQIASEAQRWRDKNPGPLALICVDYLQLIKPTRGHRSENRALEVGAWSRALKVMAGDLKAAVIEVSQLNRDNSKGKDGEMRRPVMSDLRDSGEIEQHADTILFPFRTGTTAEIGIPKNRGAPIGVVSAIWNGATTSFRDDVDDTYGVSDGRFPEER